MWVAVLRHRTFQISFLLFVITRKICRYNEKRSRYNEIIEWKKYYVGGSITSPYISNKFLQFSHIHVRFLSVSSLNKSMASWDHKSDDLAVSLFKISAFRSFFTIKSVPPTISHRSDLTSFTPFLYLPILKCDRFKSDYVDTVYRLSIV